MMNKKNEFLNRFGFTKRLMLSAMTAVATGAAGAPGELTVGFGQVDITPPVGLIITGPKLPKSVGRDDPLKARAIVVQSGARKLAIAGIDLVKIRRDLADETALLVEQRTGITRDAVLICPSHNHSSPFIPQGGPNNRDYIATNAGELFVELGLSVKRRSPFPHTVVSELTNDWIGYEPTAQGFSHEGYETLAGVNFISPKGIQDLVDTSVEMLMELWGQDGLK